MRNGHIFVLGGARSGKTAYAERLAQQLGRAPAYLATAKALDAEMAERVANHKAQRHHRFATIEEPLDLAGALLAARHDHDLIVVDCLTLWLSNLLGSGGDVGAAVDALVTVLDTLSETRIILVSNEVGGGIVPENKLARSFRDLAGSTHQRVATVAGNVYFIAAGLPMALKGSLPDWN